MHTWYRVTLVGKMQCVVSHLLRSHPITIKKKKKKFKGLSIIRERRESAQRRPEEREEQSFMCNQRIDIICVSGYYRRLT